MPFENEYVLKERLSDVVADRITAKIHSGEWKAGMRLPSERKLADALGVSRTVLREALSDRRVARLIETKDDYKYVKAISLGELLSYMSGSVVLDKKAIGEMMEVRAILEEYDARKAATCITEEQIENLQKNIDEMARLIAAGEDASSLESKFHRGLAEATGNNILLNFYNMFENLIKGTHNITWKAAAAIGAENTAISDHQAILDAIKNRDSHAAGSRMTMHLSVASDRLMKINIE